MDIRCAQSLVENWKLKVASDTSITNGINGESTAAVSSPPRTCTCPSSSRQSSSAAQRDIYNDYKRAQQTSGLQNKMSLTVKVPKQNLHQPEVGEVSDRSALGFCPWCDHCWIQLDNKAPKKQTGPVKQQTTGTINAPVSLQLVQLRITKTQRKQTKRKGFSSSTRSFNCKYFQPTASSSLKDEFLLSFPV